jgi:hypothetical protein
MARSRFAVCCFSKYCVILIHLTLSCISFIHDGALIIDDWVAVISREDLVSEIRRHVRILMTMMRLLKQPLGRSSILLRNDMMLRDPHIPIRKSVIVRLIYLSRWTHGNYSAHLIFVSILLHLPLIIFLWGRGSARFEYLLCAHIFSSLMSGVWINFLVIAVLLMLLGIPRLVLLSVVLVILILVQVWIRLHLVNVVLFIQSLVLVLIYIFLLVILLNFFVFAGLILANYLWFRDIVVLSVNLLLIHDLLLIWILT